jgi:hypothetical protein
VTDAKDRGLELGTRTVPLGSRAEVKKRDDIRAVASRDCAGIDTVDRDSVDGLMDNVGGGVDCP